MNNLSTLVVGENTDNGINSADGFNAINFYKITSGNTAGQSPELVIYFLVKRRKMVGGNDDESQETGLIYYINF